MQAESSLGFIAIPCKRKTKSNGQNQVYKTQKRRFSEQRINPTKGKERHFIMTKAHKANCGYTSQSSINTREKHGQMEKTQTHIQSESEAPTVLSQ